MSLTSSAVDFATKEVSQALPLANDDQRLVLQALTIRIMKSKKVLSHRHLVDELKLHSNANYGSDITLIKTTIEQLIDRQYLERVNDDSDMDIYRYLA